MLILPIVHQVYQATIAVALALAASLPASTLVAPPFPDQGGSAVDSSSSSLLASASPPRPVTAAAATHAAFFPPPFFLQYETADDIPLSSFVENDVIRGRVVKVIDGDTIRIRHTPLHPLSDRERACAGRRLSECTISVRLYGVDAPETAKSGRPGQPYSREATEYVSERVEGEIVQVKLLRKDRYSRVVGRVTVRDGFDLSEGLAERGYASLYTGRGAEYDGERGELEMRIRAAQDARRGIWTNGVDDFVDPASYKRKMKAGRNGIER